MKTLNDQQRAQIERLYLEGQTAMQLAPQFNVDKTTIYYVLRTRGIARRPPMGAKRVLECNHHFFDNIDSEEKAYWLGFLAADGNVCNNAVRLSLSTKDREHVERFRDALGSQHKITDLIRRRDTPVNGHIIGEFSTSTIQIKSPEMASALALHGIFPAKSHTLQWPHSLSDELLRHFARGYIDGDGCWGNYKSIGLYFKVVSSEDFLIGLRAFLARFCQVSSTTRISQRKSSGQIFVWDLTGTRQLTRVAQFLYKDATVFLPRKRAVVEPFLSDQNQKGL